MDTAAWYRWFAAHEAHGSSPQYERLAVAVADREELVDWLSELPAAKRQPNLLFASVRLLGGPTESVIEFVDFVRAHADELAEIMTERSTQTNEVARCAAFLPLLADIDGDVALIEVGASAGLCMYPDRYAYRFDGRPIGDSSLMIEVDSAGTVPMLQRMPTVVWRSGLDLSPLDVTDPGDLAWLRACVWPEHDARRQRLEQAAVIVALDPPALIRGDLRTATLDLIDAAPPTAVKVVFHSAVLAYVDEPSRRDFASTMRQLIGDRGDVVWLSNEAPTVVLGHDEAGAAGVDVPPGASFHLGRDGAELVAITDPHGAWMRWLRS